MDQGRSFGTKPSGIGRLARLASHLEGVLYAGGWPVRLARAIGVRPTVRTVRYAVALGPAGAGLPPLRIAYASDFHAGPLTDPSVLSEACAALHMLAADVLLLGGDFVT